MGPGGKLEDYEENTPISIICSMNPDPVRITLMEEFDELITFCICPHDTKMGNLENPPRV